MPVADKAPELRQTATLRSMAVATGELVVVVDHEHRAERLAADRAATTLGGEGGPNLHRAEPLASPRRLARVSGA